MALTYSAWAIRRPIGWQELICISPTQIFSFTTFAMILSKRYAESQFQLLMTETVPVINCAIEAETRSIARSNGWGIAKRDQMGFLFSTFRRVSIERPDLLEAYVMIDVYNHRHGIDMGKNDLWIAATASVTGAILLTTDKDFDHLK